MIVIAWAECPGGPESPGTLLGIEFRTRAQQGPSDLVCPALPQLQVQRTLNRIVSQRCPKEARKTPAHPLCRKLGASIASAFLGTLQFHPPASRESVWKHVIPSFVLCGKLPLRNSIAGVRLTSSYVSSPATSIILPPQAHLTVCFNLHGERGSSRSHAVTIAQDNSDSVTAGLPAHIQNLRRTLQREREIMRRQESARSERGPSAIPDAQDPRRRRYIRGAAASNTSLGSDTDGLRRRAPTRPMEPAGLSPNTAADAEWPTSDRRPTRDTPFRHTFNLRRLRQNHSDASAQLEMASERLGEAQSRLDALLRDPIMRSLSLSPSSSETRNTDGGAPQAKRRKVDHDARETFQGFHYGHFGQVIPGPLKMEIVSCDGGNYAEEDFPSVYGAENVLRNDGSVYCTQSSQCNLILRHQGETTFSLERLVIRAPEHSYTAP